MDAFNIAFRIPNLFRDMLAEGALGNAFTKLFSEYSETDRNHAVRFFQQAMTVVFLLLSSLVALGMIYSEDFVRLMTLSSGESYNEVRVQAISLTRILFPYLGLASMTAILAGTLYQKGSFFKSAITPIVGNLGYILGALILGTVFADLDIRLWFGPSELDPRILGLAVGVMMGCIGQLMLTLWFAKELILKALTQVSGLFQGLSSMKRLAVLSLPMMIASSVGPLSGLINTNFASQVGPGAVSWLAYAFRLFQLPVGLFGVAVGIVALPALTRAITRAKGNVDRTVIAELEKGLGIVFFCMLMSFSFVLVYHHQIIELIFQRGAFTEFDTISTGAALLTYSFGLFGYGFIKVLTSFYYATERTGYAVKVSFIGVTNTLVVCYFLVDVMGHIGLALASSATLTLNSSLLLLGNRSYFSLADWAAIRRTTLILLGFSGLAIGLLFVLDEILMALPIFDSRSLDLVIRLSIGLGVCMLIFGLSLTKIYRIKINQIPNFLRQSFSK